MAGQVPFRENICYLNGIPANTSQCLLTPTPQVVGCDEDDHNTSEHGVKGSKPIIQVSVSTEDKLAQQTGPSRKRHQSPSKTIFNNISQAQTPSPVAQAGLNYATRPICLLHAHLIPCTSLWPRSYVLCRFSHERLQAHPGCGTA
jgi:hypothetical protein